MLPGGGYVFVPDAPAQAVLVVDTATMTLADDYPFDDFLPNFEPGFHVAPSGTYALAIINTDGISVFSLETEIVVQEIDLPGISILNGKHNPVWSEDGLQVFVPVKAPEGVPVLSPTYEVLVDIKPGSCPNPLNRNSHGVLPAAWAALGGRGRGYTV